MQISGSCPYTLMVLHPGRERWLHLHTGIAFDPLQTPGDHEFILRDTHAGGSFQSKLFLHGFLVAARASRGRLCSRRKVLSPSEMIECETPAYTQQTSKTMCTRNER